MAQGMIRLRPRHRLPAELRYRVRRIAGNTCRYIGHPGTFNKRIEERIVIVFTKRCQPVSQGSRNTFPYAPYGCKRFSGLFHTVQRIAIAAAVVHVQPAIVVYEKIWVPAADGKRVYPPFHSWLGMVLIQMGKLVE